MSITKVEAVLQTSYGKVFILLHHNYQTKHRQRGEEGRIGRQTFGRRFDDTYSLAHSDRQTDCNFAIAAGSLSLPCWATASSATGATGYMCTLDIDTVHREQIEIN